jgi:hypothetical protein
VGTNVKKPTLEITAEDFSLVMSTNFESAYHMSQLAHPLLKASGAGSIVLLSSVSGLRSIGCGSVYEATKGNLLMQSYIFSLTAFIYIYIYIYSLLINLNYVCKFMSCFIYIYMQEQWTNLLEVWHASGQKTISGPIPLHLGRQEQL